MNNLQSHNLKVVQHHCISCLHTVGTHSDAETCFSNQNYNKKCYSFCNKES